MPEESIFPELELPEPPDTPVCNICRSDDQSGMQDINGHPRCSNCIEALQCDSCHSNQDSEDEMVTLDDGETLCDSCRFYCEYHDGYQSGEGCSTVDDQVVCQDCADAEFQYCQDCDLYVHYDYSHRYINDPHDSIDDANALCGDCIDRRGYKYSDILEVYAPEPEDDHAVMVLSGYKFNQLTSLRDEGRQIAVPGPLPDNILTFERVDQRYLDGQDITLTRDCRNNHITTYHSLRNGNEGYCVHCASAFNSIRNLGMAKEKNNMPEYTQIRPYHSHSYSHQDFLQMAKDKKENNEMYFGIELETAFSTDHISGETGEKRASRILAELKGTFIGERDGTVSNGAELISKPLSYEYLTSKTMTKRLQRAFALMRELGAINGTHNGIGLHIHVSRMPFKSKNKATVEMEDDMNWFINCFKDYVEVISKRKATNYCKFPIQQMQKPPNASRMYVNKQVLQKGSHGYALNLTQSRTPTYEFRVFNSTQDLEQLIANVEFVRNLSLFVINEPTIIGKTFRDIVMYKPTKYLASYTRKLVAQYPEQMKGWNTKKLKPELEIK